MKSNVHFWYRKKNDKLGPYNGYAIRARWLIIFAIISHVQGGSIAIRSLLRDHYISKLTEITEFHCNLHVHSTFKANILN